MVVSYYVRDDLVSKKNEDLWDLSDVVEADQKRIAAKKGTRADNMIEEENEHDNLMQDLV